MREERGGAKAEAEKVGGIKQGIRGVDEGGVIAEEQEEEEPEEERGAGDAETVEEEAAGAR